jgi:hypothetical protein
MPRTKKSLWDQANRLNGRVVSPKKVFKRVASIALKARPQKKHRNEDPDDHDVGLILLVFTRHGLSIFKVVYFYGGT